jgi:hypothetical protein
VRHGVLRQKRRLKPDLGPNPLAFRMRRIRWMVTATTTSKLRAEICALNLIILLDLAPRRIANRAGNVDLQFQDGHKNICEGFKVSEFQVFNDFLESLQL